MKHACAPMKWRWLALAFFAVAGAMNGCELRLLQTWSSASGACIARRAILEALGVGVAKQKDARCDPVPAAPDTRSPDGEAAADPDWVIVDML